MSHEIHESDRFGEVRSQGKRAWHGLGMEIEQGLTAVAAFPLIGLGWQTELASLGATLSDGTLVPVRDHRAHIRIDTKEVLGVVSNDYKPIENMELAQFADALAGEDATVQVETAGSLYSGRRVFVLVKLPRTIEVVKGDILNQYVAISNGHGGTASFQAYPTSVRIVCANTLRTSERDVSGGIRFLHTGDMAAKVKQARLVLGLAVAETVRFEKKVLALARAELSVDQVQFFLRQAYEECFGGLNGLEDDELEKAKERRETTLQAWERNLEAAHQTIPGIEGTAWAVLNAVTEWMDHERGRSGPHTDQRIHSNLFGVSSADKRKVFAQALELVK